MLNFHQLFHDLGSLPWHTIGTLVGATGVASVLTQFFKKKLELVDKKVINTVLLAFSFAPVAIQYLMNTASQNPSILGGKALVVAGFASTVIYPFVISPIDKLLEDAQAERARKEAAAAPPTSKVNIIEPSAEFQP